MLLWSQPGSPDKQSINDTLDEKTIPAWKLLLDIWRELFLASLSLVTLLVVAYTGLPTLSTAIALLFLWLLIEFTPVRPLHSLLLLTVILVYSQILFTLPKLEIVSSVAILLGVGFMLCKRRRYPKEVFSLLNEMSDELLRENSASIIAFCAVPFVARMKRFSNVYIQLHDKEHDELVLVAGTQGYSLGSRLQRPRGVGWRCMQRGKPVMIMDTARDLDYIPTSIPARSAVLVPLMSGGKRFGVLGAESNSWRFFNLRDLELLSLFATHISYTLVSVESQDLATQTSRQQKIVLKEKDEEITRLRGELALFLSYQKEKRDVHGKMV